MATTTFQNGVTLTDEDWFNDVDFLTYDLFGDSTTTASAAARLTPSIRSLDHTTGVLVTGTFSVSAQATVAGLTVGGTLSVSAQSTMAGLTVGGTLSVSAGVAGAAVATQANMESAASTGSTSLIVTPGRMQYHPGIAKVWVMFDGSATSVTSAAAYGISSITDKGTGNYNIIFSTAFSSANIAPVPGANLYNIKITSVSAASVEVTCLDLSGTAADATIVTLAVYGDQ